MMAEVFVVCFLLVACKGGNQSSSNEDDDTLSIRLAVLPTLDCLPYYYAEEEGIFDSLGLHIRLESFAAAMDADTAFCNKKADAIVSDMVKAVLWRSGGDSVSVVMSGELKLYLMTAYSARIRQTKSLKEKIIGITRHSAVDMFTDEMLWDAGFISTDLNKPQINNMTLRCLMVDQNQYDGAVMPEPYASECEARGARRIISSDDLGLTLSAVVVHDSVLNRHRGDIHLLKVGYDIAVEHINKMMETDSTEIHFWNDEPEAPSLMRYLPREMTVDVPDSLVQYQPLEMASMPNDSTFVKVMRWCRGRGLLKSEIKKDDLMKE